MNKTELLIRSLTGIFIVAITLAAMIYSPYTYLLFLVLITFFGVQEFIKMDHSSVGRVQSVLVSLLLALQVGVSGYFVLRNENPLFIIAIVPLAIACLILLQFLSSPSPSETVQKGRTYFMAAIYIGLPMLSGCIFLLPVYSYHFILVPVFLIWLNDVGAYIIGSIWGRKKIMPEISPGKSVQGTIGGGVVSLLFCVLLLNICAELPVGYVLTLGFATPLFALGGDLWESALKRNAGVKDSGHIFPGHGGILDRYDSLLFVMPVAALAYFIFVL